MEESPKMNCRTARNLVQARHDGTLAAERGSALQAHLHACSACSRLASQFDLAHQWLRDLPVEQPSDNFDWRLKLRLSQAERETVEAPRAARPASRRIWTLQFAVSTAAAALLVLTTGIALTLHQDGGHGSEDSASLHGSPQPWAPSSVSKARTAWPRLVPVRAGSPLGPELDAASAPSILGDAPADTTFLEDGRRDEPIRTYPVRY